MSAKNNCSPESRKPIKVKVKSIKRDTQSTSPCCCPGSGSCCDAPCKKEYWMVGTLKTDVGEIPVVSASLVFKDRFGALKVRWGVNRMNYKVDPGIYAVGNPNRESPVLVTANYKLTFDALRKQLEGLNVWILVLDTKGINVWCAAGKGTFGTAELIRRIGVTKLDETVSHKTVILPQLGAPGVSGYEVTKQTGFQVIFGPVRAKDIKAFLASEMKATAEMRKVRFTFRDRIVLTPVEIVAALKPAIIFYGVLFLMNLFAAYPFGFADFYTSAGAVLAGCFLTPVLLPFIPGKVFAFKGWLIGFLWMIAVILINGGFAAPSFGILREISYLLGFPAASAYLAMNFTGSSAYTSFSGVMKEMKLSLPVMIAMGITGAILLLISCFIRL